MSFFEELKRRNVFRVGIAYVLLGWVVLQAADFALDLIDAPNWIIQALFITGLAGLPIALFFAWAFEITPEGIKREEDVDRSSSVTPTTGRKLDRAIIVFLSLALVLVLGERFFLAERTGPPAAGNADRAAMTGARSAEPVLEPKSVAVLPFEDLSQAGDQAWFADGLAEEILNTLVRVPDLQVASRTSSFQFGDSGRSVSAIADELGVAHVLEGSVRSSGDRVRVSAQLTRADDGFAVWSESYDRNMEDMIAIQEDLAQNIAVALETTMDPAALAAMAEVGTQSVAAYQAYLKGLNLRARSWSSSYLDGFLQAYEQFEAARALDPAFSSAHVEAADFWRVQLNASRIDTGLTDLSAREVFAEYRSRIDAASRSSRSETDRLRILADQAQVETRIREALALYLRYLQDRPNDDNARVSAIQLAEQVGEKDTARALLEPLTERSQTDFGAAIAFANIAFRTIDPDVAATVGLRSLRRWPNDDGLLYQVHRTLLWANRRLEAAELADRYRTVVPGSNPILDARDACARGDRAAAEAALDSLDEDVGNYASSTWLINSMLGKQEAATAPLKRLEANGVPFALLGLLNYTQFDPRPFPSLMKVLEEENINRPPPVTEPFACPPPEQTSVAVLAFENMSPDPNNAYFAEGISEEILNVLSGLDDLRVIARTSAFSFKGTGATVADIADTLDVGYVLEGSVRRAGDRVRVTAQLIDTDTESHLWSDSYDRDLDDIFAVQDEIARAIAGELELQLTESQEDTLVIAPTGNLEAYNQYLLGRQLWHQRTGKTLRAAVDALQTAVELDPDFAEAWAALGDALVLIPEYDLQRDVSTVPAARDAVNRALELKPDLPQALTTRAYLRFMYDFDWDNAEKDFQRAMALDPAYPTAQQWYGEFLAIRYRDVEGALQQLRKASELDPLAPVMWHVSGLLAQYFGRPEEASQYYERTLAINPNAETTYANMAGLFAGQGDYERARRYLDRFWSLSTGSRPQGQPVFIDALQDPLKRLEYIEFLKQTETVPSGPVDRAQQFMLLGETELALEDLERGLDLGRPYATHVNIVGAFAPLRDDPRFQAHLAKMNLWPPAER